MDHFLRGELLHSLVIPIPPSVDSGVDPHLLHLLLNVRPVRHHEITVGEVPWPLLLDVTTDHVGEFELSLVYAF